MNDGACQLAFQRARRYAEQGFTIMELLVVMALAAFLMTLGATVFMSGGQGATFNQAVSDVTALVNTARDASSTVPAAMIIDPEKGEVWGQTARRVQALYFEPFPAGDDEQESDGVDVAMGIRGYDVERMDGEIVARGGHVGGGLRLAPGQIVDCGNYAPYDVRDGLFLSVFVQPTRRLSGAVIEKGSAFSIAFVSGGRLSVKIQVEDDKGDPEMVERDVKIPETRPGDWVGVSVTYDRQFLTVATDHGFGPVQRDRHPETRALRIDPDASLVLGGPAFDGVMDDFVFSGVHSTEPIRMPRDVSLLGKARAIRFVGGRLDESAHQGMEAVGIQFKGKVRTLQIGKSGMVQDIVDSGTADQGAEADPSGAEFEKAD
jgi:prepilin-type N-terminal cleavage/methylation domain-containing protein